jgi:hypothetical protein
MKFKIRRTTEATRGTLVQEVSCKQKLWLIHYQKEIHLARPYDQDCQIRLQPGDSVIVVAKENATLLFIVEKEKTSRDRDKLMKFFSNLVEEFQEILLSTLAYSPFLIVLAESPLLPLAIILVTLLSVWLKR